MYGRRIGTDTCFFSKYFGFPLSIITLPIINFRSSTIDYIQSTYRQHCSIYYNETSEIIHCDPYGTPQKSFAYCAGKDRHYSRELGPHTFGQVAASINHAPVCTHTAIRLCCFLQYVCTSFIGFCEVNCLF